MFVKLEEEEEGNPVLKIIERDVKQGEKKGLKERMGKGIEIGEGTLKIKRKEERLNRKGKRKRE